MQIISHSVFISMGVSWSFQYGLQPETHTCLLWTQYQWAAMQHEVAITSMQIISDSVFMSIGVIWSFQYGSCPETHTCLLWTQYQWSAMQHKVTITSMQIISDSVFIRIKALFDHFNTVYILKLIPACCGPNTNERKCSINWRLGQCRSYQIVYS